MAPRDKDKPKSTLGFQYPSARDHPFRTSDVWLEGKRADDRLDGLWRIHDGLYDFTAFVRLHPGGSDWLELSKGTDITEAFEAHHLTTKPEQLLPKYFVRRATRPRTSPFTLKEGGFYKTLKKRVAKEIENIPRRHSHRSKTIADILLLAYLFTAMMATSTNSYLMGATSGTLLALLAIVAHNFFHQKDNFRMYYFDLTFMSSRAWRISHVLSHHIFTNTIYDMEISAIEPMLQFMPTKKNFVAKYLSWIYSPIFYFIIYVLSYIFLITQAVKNRKPLRKENYLPIITFLFLYLTNTSFFATLTMFLWIQSISSLVFGVIGVNAAHHHPDIFHDGDKARPKEELDWGIHQLDAVMERREITGSHFWALVTFGEHGLHHLFPTLDHGTLAHLYPVFEETCKEFGAELRTITSLDLAIGQYRQLSKVVPNPNPPKKLK